MRTRYAKPKIDGTQQWRDCVGRTGGIGNDPRVAQLLLIGAEDNGPFGRFRWTRDQHVSRAGINASFRKLSLLNLAGTLQHHVDAAQVQCPQIWLG